MTPADFTALIAFVQGTFVTIWAMLDARVIVQDATYKLTMLTAGVSIVFLYIIITIINLLRSGSK